MSEAYNQMKTLERKVKSMTTKFDALDQECTDRGIGLTKLSFLIEKAIMPDETRKLLREAVQPFIDRCTQGKKK